MLEQEKIILTIIMELDKYRAKKSAFLINCCQNFFQDDKNKICTNSISWKYTIENNNEKKITFIYEGNYEDLNVFLKSFEEGTISFLALCPNFINKGLIKIKLPNVKDNKGEEVFETIINIDNLGILYSNNKKVFNNI